MLTIRISLKKIIGDYCNSPTEDIHALRCLLCDQTQPYISSTLVFYYTQHVSAVQISHYQVGVGYRHEKNIKIEELILNVLFRLLE